MDVEFLKFEDKRADQASKIDLAKTKALLQPPIIFLCGGVVDINKTENDSVRDALLCHLASVGSDLSDHITYAENYKDWLHDGMYANLLQFEDDIAHIASLTVIILESAGSIAELGAFAVNKVLNQKLLVFICDAHYEEDSFIKLGPLRHVESVREGTVCSYPWDIDNPDSTVTSSLAHIQSDIEEFVETVHDTESFSIGHAGHLAFLIYEFVSIYRALKLTEIETYLKKAGISFTRDRVKRLLFLLIKFEFVGLKKRGKIDFYFPIKKEQRLRLGGEFDRRAATMNAMQYYATNADDSPTESKRLSVIQEFVLPKKDAQGAAA